MSRRERFIALVADRAEGAKVNIPAIVRVLTPTQMQIVAAIERLIADGDLDAETLRRPIETPVQLPEAELAEPPERVAVAKGGGDDARNQQSPSPIDLDRLLACFGLEFETLRAVAQRFGASSPQKIVRHARTLHERGQVEQSPPANGQPFCLWRRAQSLLGLSRAEIDVLPAEVICELSKPAQVQIAKVQRGYERKTDAPLGDRRYAVNRQDTQGASGTARKAPGAEESISAKRIEDRAPVRPTPRPRPEASATLPVDIKVNEMPARPTGKDLAERLDAWSKETGGSLVRLGLHLFNSQAGIRTLRDVRQPKQATVERVLAFLDDPLPPDKLPLRVKPLRPPRTVCPASVDIEANVPARRDPTQPPETPLTDLRERQSQNGYRHAAAVRRGQEAEATRLLDAGYEPSAISSSLTANLMRAIQRRRAEDARLADPIEQAKTLIRRKQRFPVFNADVSIGAEGKGKFFIGNRLVDEAELLDFAKRCAA